MYNYNTFYSRQQVECLKCFRKPCFSLSLFVRYLFNRWTSLEARILVIILTFHLNYYNWVSYETFLFPFASRKLIQGSWYFEKLNARPLTSWHEIITPDFTTKLKRDKKCNNYPILSIFTPTLRVCTTVGSSGLRWRHNKIFWHRWVPIFYTYWTPLKTKDCDRPTRTPLVSCDSDAFKP